MKVLRRRLLGLLYNTVRNPATVLRNWNSFRYHRQLFNKSAIDYTPPVFIATVVDTCNLRCPTCLYLLKNKDRFFRSFIEVEKFKRIMEKYNKNKRAGIIFLTGGEPLLHPQFDELVDICKSYGLKTKASTNGILARKKISSLVKCDYVNVSVDSYDYGTFKEYRGGSRKQFDSLLESLGALKDVGVYFSMSFLLSADNIFEVHKMIKFSEVFKPDFVYFHNINPHNSEYKSLNLADKEVMGLVGDLTDRNDYKVNITIPHIFNEGKTSFHSAKCLEPWEYFAFNSVGNISYCCHLDHDSSIGNVFGSYDFNSEKMINFRKGIMNGEVGGDCLYCQRRFLCEPVSMSFNRKKRKWKVQL